MNNHYEQNHYQINENQFSPNASAAESYSESFTSTETEEYSRTFNNDSGCIVYDTDITTSDVLCGRGKGVSARDGNKFYSRLIRQYKDEYQNDSNNKLKKKIAQRVLDIVKYQDPPGRFLKSTGGTDQPWDVMDDKFATKKIIQALREKPKKPSVIRKKFSLTNLIKKVDVRTRRKSSSSCRKLMNEIYNDDHNCHDNILYEVKCDTIGTLPSESLDRDEILRNLETFGDHNCHDNILDEVKCDTIATSPSESSGGDETLRTLESFDEENLCSSMRSLSTTEIDDIIQGLGATQFPSHSDTQHAC
jgi:hypothetical protein